MIMCVLLCYPVSFDMLQLLFTGRPISNSKFISVCLIYSLFDYIFYKGSLNLSVYQHVNSILDLYQ